MNEITDIERLRYLLTKAVSRRATLTKDEIDELRSVFADGEGDAVGFLHTLRWCWSPDIEHAVSGSNADWRGGAVTLPGWYVHPCCDAGCCRPRGPFGTWEDALRTHRAMMRHSIRDDMELDIEKLIHPLDADDLADDASH